MKYLIQEGSNHVYVWSERLASRKDMRPYDAEKKGLAVEERVSRKTVPIELQGKTFRVEEDLHDVLTEMGDVMMRMQEENGKLKTETANFEAFRERLTTDNLDLQEQLDAANERIKELAATQPDENVKEEARPETKPAARKR